MYVQIPCRPDIRSTILVLLCQHSPWNCLLFTTNFLIDLPHLTNLNKLNASIPDPKLTSTTPNPPGLFLLIIVLVLSFIDQRLNH